MAEAQFGKGIPGSEPVPLAGVAFMWFLGVRHDRLGVMEDKFFATVSSAVASCSWVMLFVRRGRRGLSGLIPLPAAISDGSTFICSRVCLRRQHVAPSRWPPYS